MTAAKVDGVIEARSLCFELDMIGRVCGRDMSPISRVIVVDSFSIFSKACLMTSSLNCSDLCFLYRRLFTGFMMTELLRDILFWRVFNCVNGLSQQSSKLLKSSQILSSSDWSVFEFDASEKPLSHEFSSMLITGVGRDTHGESDSEKINFFLVISLQ